MPIFFLLPFVLFIYLYIIIIIIKDRHPRTKKGAKLFTNIINLSLGYEQSVTFSNISNNVKYTQAWFAQKTHPFFENFKFV